MASYATSQDFIKRYDARVLGGLVGDNGDPVTGLSLLSNANLQAALDDASGMIDAAVLVAEKYSPSDLTNLTGTSQAYLIRITCNLAFGLLSMRRGQPTEEIAQYQEAVETLSQLRNGERVFAVAANEEAGLPDAQFPSASVYSNLQLMRDVAKNFPVRRNQRIE